MMRMHIPRYWAEAKARQQSQRKRLTLQRWGWSDNSQEDAQAHANVRVAQAMEDALRVWPASNAFPRREVKVPYNGAEGVPIREEVVEARPDGVITRNSYGALCLNVDDVLFVDVDNDVLLRMPPGSARRAAQVAGVMALCVAVLSWWLPRAIAGAFAEPQWVVALKCLFVVFCGSWMLGYWGWKTIHIWQVKRAGLAIGAAARAVQEELVLDPRGCWRIYETPNGARILAMHDLFDPASQATQDLMRRLRVDPLYAAMCRRQNCFRARVSPKPWRIPGVERLRGPVWPVVGEALVRRAQWVAAYAAVSPAFAACRFASEWGRSFPAHAKASTIKAWHDAMCQANSGKPLA